MNNFYVYVYIDPRNHDEFYYGKGRGSRKDSHLTENSHSAKSKQIKEIQAEGLDPVVRVIARNLSETDALLVEKTLLWKLGKHLTNVSTGYFADNFRPHNTLHTKLGGFDYENSLYYFNVGEGETRCWADYRKYGFISAGQGMQWREQISSFEKGDVIAAYLKGKGFVGVGRIVSQAKPVREVFINNKPLLSYPLKQPNLANNQNNDDMSEYVAVVEWLSSVKANDAKWKPKSGLYTTPLVKASLANQPKTVAYLEEVFDISFEELLT